MTFHTLLGPPSPPIWDRMGGPRSLPRKGTRPIERELAIDGHAAILSPVDPQRPLSARTVDGVTSDVLLPWVFHRHGKPVKDIRTTWKTATEKAGLKGAWIHDLRRSAVRNMERAGVSRSVAMKLSGHKTEHVYTRYAIADAAALHEGVEKLAQLHDDDGDGRSVVPLEGARRG